MPKGDADEEIQNPMQQHVAKQGNEEQRERMPQLVESDCKGKAYVPEPPVLTRKDNIEAQYAVSSKAILKTRR